MILFVVNRDQMISDIIDY